MSQEGPGSPFYNQTTKMMEESIETIIEGNGLEGPDGNAFSIMGRVKQAMKKAGAVQADLDNYFNEATSGDYDNLQKVSVDWLEKFGYEHE